MQCVNNLKQIGLAMHNYLSANNTFPMGGTPQMDPTGSYPTVTGPWEWENYSSFAMMLPYLEQQTVFNACNLMICPDTGGGVPQPWNSTVYYTKLNAFLCPSDPYSGIQDLCNYAGCFGTTTWMPYDQVNSSLPNNGHADTTGIFTIWKSYGIQSVTDGTSNTMAFAEQLVGYGASGYQRYAAVRRKSHVSRKLGLHSVKFSLCRVVAFTMSARSRMRSAWYRRTSSRVPASS